MHDDRLRFHELHPAAVEPPEGGVLPQRGHELLVLALLLNPQQVDDIEFRQDLFKVVAHLGPPALDGGRDERRRGDQGHLRPHLGQGRHVGAGNPGVEDVADDAHPEAVEAREVLPDRVQVEQGLGRVLVGSVAGVDDAGLHPPGEPVRRPRRGVPHDDGVDPHGLQRLRRVLEGLALGQGGPGVAGEVDHVGREALGGKLEGDPGARRGLEEQVADGAAPQDGHLLDRASAHLPEGVGGLQHELDLAGRELVDRQQMLDHDGPSVMTTESAPSISASRTSTASRLEVGRFLPM